MTPYKDLTQVQIRNLNNSVVYPKGVGLLLDGGGICLTEGEGQ